MRRAVLIAFAAAAAAASLGAGGKTVRVDLPANREVFVPGGAFQMGITKEARQNILDECTRDFQIPETNNWVCELYGIEMEHMEARTVFVSAFWIDRDEVSVTDYRACVAGGGCVLDPLVSGDQRFVVPDWPLVNVTWNEAQAYCRWHGGGLPTEAQWERAARGDTDSTWPWGDVDRPIDFNHGQPRSELEQRLDRNEENIPQYAGNADGSDGAEYLAPVGSYRWGDGPYGTRDQAGNAAEWTADAYLLRTIPPKDEPTGYDGLGVIDPYRAGTIGDLRVVRGGSWRQPTVVARTNVRDPLQQWTIRPERRSPYVGFRCARSAR